MKRVHVIHSWRKGLATGDPRLTAKGYRDGAGFNVCDRHSSRTSTFFSKKEKKRKNRKGKKDKQSAAGKQTLSLPGPARTAALHCSMKHCWLLNAWTYEIRQNLINLRFL